MSTVIAGEGTFESAGLQIFFRSWRPSLTPRAAVLIVPGFNSHSAYYAWTAQELVADRLAVYALDLRGRGKSDGERFYVETFNDYVSDVSRCVALVKSREPGVPLYLLGHMLAASSPVCSPSITKRCSRAWSARALRT